MKLADLFESREKPRFYEMTLDELSAWVSKHNHDMFDELPSVDELDDEEAEEAREELESMADQIWHRESK